jgi:hypothetical protein
LLVWFHSQLKIVVELDGQVALRERDREEALHRVQWLGVVLCAIVWASGRLTRSSSTQGLDDPPRSPGVVLAVSAWIVKRVDGL